MIELHAAALGVLAALLLSLWTRVTDRCLELRAATRGAAAGEG